MFLNIHESKTAKSCTQQLRGCGSDRDWEVKYRQGAVCFFHSSRFLSLILLFFRGYFLLHVLVMCWIQMRHNVHRAIRLTLIFVYLCGGKKRIRFAWHTLKTMTPKHLSSNSLWTGWNRWSAHECPFQGNTSAGGAASLLDLQVLQQAAVSPGLKAGDLCLCGAASARPPASQAGAAFALGAFF